jgi:4-hydroxy-2-oxoheptanedioate aldolase
MKQQLRQDQPVFGGSLRTPEPTVVEVLSDAGDDHAVLDGEHGAQSCEAPEILMLTAYASDITAVVRVLDLGAQGVLVPHIKSSEDARRAVAALYPPAGQRGIGPSRGA